MTTQNKNSFWWPGTKRVVLWSGTFECGLSEQKRDVVASFRARSAVMGVAWGPVFETDVVLLDVTEPYRSINE